MTQLPRAATTTEKALMRLDNQSTRLYLTVHQPATVYTAHVATVPSTTDQITSIDYDSGVGTHTNILADMTLLVGTTAGGFDLGQARIRNTDGLGATSGTMQLGEESEINWGVGGTIYLTVLDEFLIWPRHIKIQGTTPIIDEITYTNQNSHCDSIPIMGPDRVLWLRGATVSTTMDWSNSWAIGNSITGYVATCPGASATSGLTTSTPTLTFNAVGVYRVSCQATNSDGAVFTGYRYIFVVDETHGVTSEFTLNTLEGSQSAGGWTCAITLYGDAALTQIRDKALCILHRRDWYGNTEQSIGFCAGAENIEFIGWITDEDDKIQRDDLYGTVTFNIEGPQFWLDQIPAFPEGLKDVTSTPTKWTRWFGLNIKDTIWHLLHWRSTATRCIDCYPIDNTWRAARIEAPGAQSLWQQMSVMLDTTVKAKPYCDSLARLFCEVEQQLLNTTQRSAIPEVMTVEKQDLTGSIDFKRNMLERCALADVQGVSFDGTTPTPIAALSPGQVFGRLGRVETIQRLVAYDSAQMITLAGLFRGWYNNNYPKFPFQFAANFKLIDIAPYMYLDFSIAAADTPRNVAFSGRLIPRSIRRSYQNGYMLTQADLEAETFAQLAIENVVPPVVITPPEPPPNPPPPPPPPPLPSGDAKILWMIHSDALGATNPPLAVIYEILDDYNAPVYTKIVPPGGLNLDRLYYGNYNPSTDSLILVGHATATDAVPSPPGGGGPWAGGPARVTILVTNATTVSPSWSIVLINGVTSQFAIDFPTDLNQSSFQRYGTSGGVNIVGNTGPYAYIVNLTHTAVGGHYDHPAGNTTDGGALHSGSVEVQQTVGYWRVGSELSATYTGPMPDGYDPNPPNPWSYYTNAGHGTLYNYQGNGVEAGSPAYVYTLRSTIADNSLSVVRLQAFWMGYGDFDPITWTVFGALTETDNGHLSNYWSNTLNAANYCNVNLQPYNVLYYNDNGVWGKMPGTLLGAGTAHYIGSSGGRSSIFVASGTVANSNEFARYTTDLTAGSWLAMTGNMWSGVNKIITSGDLKITDSFLSY